MTSRTDMFMVGSVAVPGDTVEEAMRVCAKSAGHRLASIPDGASDEHFVVTHSVEVAGIEKRHATFDRGVNDGDALCVVCLAVGAGQSHAAECESRERRVGAE